MIDCALGSRLLEVLADGQRHSLKALSMAQDVSESNVRQCLEALVLAGAALNKPSDNTWQMRPGVDLLDKELIEAGLLHRKLQTTLNVVNCVNSTNDHVRQNPLPSRNDTQVSIAEMQIYGRGRQGRSWQAGFGKNIMLSIRSVVHVSPRWLSRLPILSGIAMAHLLHECGVEDCGVKWPNDLVVMDKTSGIKKLAGILVESSTLHESVHDVVIGIGLNVDTSGVDIDQPGIDLKDTTVDDDFLCRSRLAVACIETLSKMLFDFDTDHGESLLPLWVGYDVLKGLPITVKQVGGEGNNIDRGRAAGIGATGELLVDTPEGRQSLYAGDVSVRLQ